MNGAVTRRYMSLETMAGLCNDPARAKGHSGHLTIRAATGTGSCLWSYTTFRGTTPGARGGSGTKGVRYARFTDQ
jgi:hypothetical protein